MIIKCPECGHQISDKAPVCPSCGVEIAGKIVRCPHCGEIHFISDGICPNCHHSLTERPGGKSERTDASLHGNADAQIVSDGTEDPGTADTMDWDTSSSLSDRTTPDCAWASETNIHQPHRHAGILCLSDYRHGSGHLPAPGWHTDVPAVREYRQPLPVRIDGS